MNHQQGSAAERSTHWVTISEAFLQAAASLPAQAEMALPRRELLGRAVEYRLKAYLCASRGGAPETDDLGRLLVLARHVGLALDDRARAVVTSLARPPQDDVVPDDEQVREVCRAISTAMTAL